MMAGNPSWWSMESNMRLSTTATENDEDNDGEGGGGVVSPHNNNNNNLMFISQQLEKHHHHPPVHEFLHHHPSSSCSSSPINNNTTTSSSSSSSSSSSTTTSAAAAAAATLLPFSSLSLDHHHHAAPAQDFPHSWSQLLLGGMGGGGQREEERFGQNVYESTRMMNSSSTNGSDVKQEVVVSSPNNTTNYNLYGYHNQDHPSRQGTHHQLWSAGTIPASSPKSCVTSLSTNNNSNNMLDFSTTKTLSSLQPHTTHHLHDVHHSNSECNSTATAGPPNKKPRVQSSSTPPLKVRKEKLGDRITALHQLVSPFGKTDTASVLLEAIGYIRFLQGQIEALSSPYLGNNNAPHKNNLQTVHGERNCLFPEHPGQLLNNDSCLKRRGAATQEEGKDIWRDLKSRGLCLVPISCTHLVGSDNGADYWAPSLGAGF